MSFVGNLKDVEVSLLDHGVDIGFLHVGCFWGTLGLT